MTDRGQLVAAVQVSAEVGAQTTSSLAALGDVGHGEVKAFVVVVRLMSTLGLTPGAGTAPQIRCHSSLTLALVVLHGEALFGLLLLLVVIAAFLGL